MVSDMAAEEIIRRHYDAIFAYCYRHTGDREAAQDLTQETFLRMLKSFDKYTHYDKLQNFLYVIARNACKDYFKKQKPIYLAELPLQTAKENDTDTALTVRAAVLTLPFKERDAVILKYYHDCTTQQIAEITGATLAVTKYRLRRATQKLREALKGE